jgi:hypothetical protein
MNSLFMLVMLIIGVENCEGVEREVGRQGIF